LTQIGLPLNSCRVIHFCNVSQFFF